MKLRYAMIAPALVASALAAHAAVSTGETLGTTEAEIRATLEASGYVIQEIEVEGDEIEVEATLDGAAYEIELSAATGEILEIEAEDDDDDGDN
ncbi:MAG: PepSY domain-containing protein [Pseudomonadota bacterium]